MMIITKKVLKRKRSSRAVMSEVSMSGVSKISISSIGVKYGCGIIIYFPDNILRIILSLGLKRFTGSPGVVSAMPMQYLLKPEGLMRS